MATICLVNQSKKISTADLETLALGLTISTKDVTDEWELAPRQVVTKMVPGAWPVYFVDEFADPSLTGILGYHDVVDETPTAWIRIPSCSTTFGVIVDIPEIGSPGDTGYEPAKETVFALPSVSEVCSHEIAEMLIDPYVNQYADDSKGHLMLMEDSDAADSFRYVVTVKWTVPYVGADPHKKIVNHFRKMTVQDFVTPKYYLPGHVGPCSHTGQVKAAFTVGSGCYASLYNVTGQPVSIGSDRLGGGKS